MAFFLAMIDFVFRIHRKHKRNTKRRINIYILLKLITSESCVIYRFNYTLVWIQGLVVCPIFKSATYDLFY